MLIVAYDIHGVILHHAVPPRQMVNAAYYFHGPADLLQPALGRKWRHLVVQNPIILHDNARSHTASVAMNLLCHWQWGILEHPPYSPHMSPCDYDLSAKLKEPLQGTQYRTPSFFMTMQGVTPLLLPWISCATDNGGFWNIHRTHPISGANRQGKQRKHCLSYLLYLYLSHLIYV